MHRALLLVPLLLATGCHAKFKKFAPTLGSVRTQVLVTGGPYVQLGKVSGSGEGDLTDVAAAVINVVQTVKEVDQTDRIASAVRIDDVNAAMERGLADTLGSGPPFAWTDGENAGATLQVEVLSYGLAVAYLGAPGDFTYDLRLRIYKPDGERVYSSHTSCTIGAGSPNAASVALGAVNNVKQLQEMSDEDINAAFGAVATWCGQEVVRKMRKHAG